MSLEHRVLSEIDRRLAADEAGVEVE
jgi:hypothetical protein